MVKFPLYISTGFSDILQNKLPLCWHRQYSLSNLSVFVIMWCIQSRIPQMSVEDIHILFSYEGVLRSSTFQYNHYVPIIFHPGKEPALKIKNLNLNKKGEKKVKKVDLNSQNTQKRLWFHKVIEKHSSKESITLPCNQSQELKNKQSKLSFSKCKPKNKNSVQFELPLKVNNSGSEIESLSSNSAIDQSLPLKIKWFKLSNPVCAIKFCSWSATFFKC